MGLVGQVLYPCVVRPDAVPVKQQLAKLAKADADADAAGEPAPIAPSDVKLYWRVVTRGLSPDLVAANVHSAFAVLKESGLPRERWEVEVVCDNAMGLPERTGTEVLEVVPVDGSYDVLDDEINGQPAYASDSNMIYYCPSVESWVVFVFVTSSSRPADAGMASRASSSLPMQVTHGS
mgnify:CR=1 FL=1